MKFLQSFLGASVNQEAYIQIPVSININNSVAQGKHTYF